MIRTTIILAFLALAWCERSVLPSFSYIDVTRDWHHGNINCYNSGIWAVTPFVVLFASHQIPSFFNAIMKSDTVRGVVYEIKSPSGRVYIGKTIDFRRRMYQYGKGLLNKQPKLKNSIECHGWDNHSVSIIHILTPMPKLAANDALAILEMHYIQLYDSKNAGLNCTDGGEGCRGRGTMSPEGRKKISDSMKNRKVSDYTRQLMSTNAKARWSTCRLRDWRITNEQRAKWATTMAALRASGKIRKRGPMSDSQKQKLSAIAAGRPSSFKGKCHTAQSNEKNRRAHQKPVLQVDVASGTVIRVWESVASAAQAFGISGATILDCCHSGRVEAGGYAWQRRKANEHVGDVVFVPKNKQKKCVAQCNRDSQQIISVWPSARSAAIALNISVTSISQCCHAKRRNAGGYSWVFYPTPNKEQS